MEFQVNLIGRKNLSGEIYRQIRKAIGDGRLRPGDCLPASRDLAHSLKVSRTTVTVAYDRLAGEGYLVSRGYAQITDLVFNRSSIRREQFFPLFPVCLSSDVNQWRYEIKGDYLRREDLHDILNVFAAKRSYPLVYSLPNLVFLSYSLHFTGHSLHSQFFVY